MSIAKRLAPLAVFAAVGLAAPANAQTVTVGNADDSNCIPFGCARSFTLSRYQQVFSAAAFGGISGPIDIMALTFFNTFNPLGGQFSAATFTIALSTTTAAVNDLSGNLASNVGSNNTAFATVTTTNGATGSQFTINGSGFVYDPSQGNLLLDILISSLGSDAGVTAYFASQDFSDAMSRAYVSSGFGQPDDGGLVTQFTYAPVTATPEPATLSLLSTGLVGLVGWRRRKARPADV